MSAQLNELQQELAELVDRHTDRDGYLVTKIPNLYLARYSGPHYSTLTGPPYRIYNPSIGIAVQGTKAAILGNNRIYFGPSNYLVASMDLPTVFETIDGSKEAPSLTCKIEFTPGLVVDLLNTEELKDISKSSANAGSMLTSSTSLCWKLSSGWFACWTPPTTFPYSLCSIRKRSCTERCMGRTMTL